MGGGDYHNIGILVYKNYQQRVDRENINQNRYMGYIYYSNNIKMPMPKCNDHRNDLRNINTDMMIDDFGQQKNDNKINVI